MPDTSKTDKTMTSREIVRAVLEFKDPPRIAMFLPDPHPNDFHFFMWKVRENEPLQPQGSEVRRWKDEWGVTWASLTDYDAGEAVVPAIRDWADLDTYEPPDLGRADVVGDAAEQGAADTEKFRVGFLPGFTFNIGRKLRNLENYLCDLVLDREQIDRLNAMVRAQLLGLIDRWGEAGMDAIMFCEDWGTQDRLMVSPAMWRDVFRPEFEALAGRAHEHGMFVMMHSCGKVTEIIDDCNECGVDCFQFDQPRLHGIDTLASRFGGKAAFWCPVDIQQTLQTRDPKQIRAEARELIQKLGGFHGGFIAGHYGGMQAIGLTDDVQDIACKAFVEFSDYQ